MVDYGSPGANVEYLQRNNLSPFINYDTSLRCMSINGRIITPESMKRNTPELPKERNTPDTNKSIGMDVE